MPPELDRDYRRMGLYGEIKSRRGRVNYFYRIEAIGVLKRDPERFGWLYNPEANVIKNSILTELGRIGDPEVIAAAADRVCELKPSTRDAVNMIRRFRIGRSPEGNSDALAKVILRAIDEYRTTHSIDYQAVTSAIREAHDVVYYTHHGLKRNRVPKPQAPAPPES